jgi:hypothetical protein
MLMGDSRATWDALVSFAYYPGRGSELFEETLAAEERVRPQKLEGSLLAWLCCYLRDAGLDTEHPFVKRCLENLLKKQRSDGSWDSENGEAFAANATVEALRVIKHYGLV